MTTADLPAVNAVLNGSAAVLLLVGRVLIARQQKQAHRFVMVTAFAVSALFLASYLTYHAIHGSTRFPEIAGWRPVYLGILLTHTILAVVNLPLILVTFARALKGRFAEHRRIARWSWAIWMYVSVTGVVIYLLLYQVAPRLV